MKALNVGIDTIKVSGEVVGISAAAFTSRHQSAARDGRVFDKFVYQGHPNEPRCTYYPANERMVIEVSWPKFVYGHNTRLIDEPALAIEMLNAWLHRVFSISVNVGDWRCNRIDYAADWMVGRALPVYIEALQRSTLSNHDRSDYDNNGVMWRSKSRAIKFYNKTRETGLLSMESAVLRFEVSNYRDAVRYICSGQGMANSLTALASGSVVRIVLSQWLSKCMPIGFGADESVRARVYELFPHAAGQALEHLRLINEHGTQAYWNGWTNKSSYYRYRKALRDANLLGESSSSLPLLAI